MNKIIRFYNRNRITFWLCIIVIIFIITIIQVANNVSKEQAEEEKELAQNEVITENPYENESKSIISSTEVSEEHRDEFGELIENFLRNCSKHEYEQAYNMLTNECKQQLYPTMELFKAQYCDANFEKDCSYSFQSWTSTVTYTYEVKIFENMLATGKPTTNTYIRDYITIIDTNGDYKLNISSYIGRKTINTSAQNSGITIDVLETNKYKDYEIYTFKVKNDTQNDILLDNRENTTTTYLLDDNKVKFKSLLYEKIDENLIVQKGKTKTVTIKFNDAYREDLKIEKIVFSNIILDYNNYNPDNENTPKSTIEIEVSK